MFKPAKVKPVYASARDIPVSVPMPLQKLPDNFDPEQEKRRMHQGGCCGSPPSSKE